LKIFLAPAKPPRSTEVAALENERFHTAIIYFRLLIYVAPPRISYVSFKSNSCSQSVVAYS
jgi:hypothetical protein